MQITIDKIKKIQLELSEKSLYGKSKHLLDLMEFKETGDLLKDVKNVNRVILNLLYFSRKDDIIDRYEIDVYDLYVCEDPTLGVEKFMEYDYQLEIDFSIINHQGDEYPIPVGFIFNDNLDFKLDYYNNLTAMSKNILSEDEGYEYMNIISDTDYVAYLLQIDEDADLVTIIHLNKILLSLQIIELRDLLVRQELILIPEEAVKFKRVFVMDSNTPLGEINRTIIEELGKGKKQFNITVNGTDKTPTIGWLAKLLESCILPKSLTVTKLKESLLIRVKF